MFSPGKKLDNIYRRIGNRGVLLVIFLTGVFAHTVFALQTELISIDPNEFGVAAWAALYSGKNWSGVMSKIGYFYGYAGAVLYTPVMLVVKNPFIQYKVMLILNGIIVSAVPMIAYKISSRLGVEKAWHRILISIACGLYSTGFAHTKFIWNETACIVIPWLILFLLIQTMNEKNRIIKHLLSVLAAFVAIFAFAAHPRLISVSVTAVLVILFTRIFMKKKLVYLTSFFPALIIFGLFEQILRTYLINIMWGENAVLLQNTIESGVQSFSGLWTDGGAARFIQTLFGHLYYFATSTWGLGALAFCLVFVMTGSYFKAKNKKSGRNFTDEFIIFGIFAFLLNILALLVSVINKFNTAGFEQYQDSAIFGRYMDSVIPLLIMLVISYVFVYSLDFIKLLSSIITLGIIYTAFFIFTMPVIIGAEKTRVSPILGLYPIRIGQSIDAVITIDGLFLTVSSVFCFMALFIVIVCCARRYRAHIISICMICTMLYSSFYTAIVYLPFAAAEAKSSNVPIYEISEHIYNSADAPYVYTYKTPRKTYTLLQYLNQETYVLSVNGINDLPENCFIVVPNSERLALRPESEQIFWELKQTSEYTLYAYGERAAAFAQSQGTEIG